MIFIQICLLLKAAVYYILLHKKNGYIKLGGGIFGLTEWEKESETTEKDTVKSRLFDVLSAVSKPLHYKEIHCIHNQLFPNIQISKVTVNFILSKNPDLFIKVGNGVYGLAEWGLEKTVVERNNLQDELRQILQDTTKPTNYNEIQTRYNALHPFSTLSSEYIHKKLNQSPKVFIKVGGGLYGLAEWGLGIKETNDYSIQNKLRQILINNSKPMHYTELQSVYNQLYPTHIVSDKSINQRLNKSPEIFVKVGSGVYGLVEWGLEITESDHHTTQGRLQVVLMRDLKSMHYIEIHEKHNRLYPEKALSASTIYGTLSKYSEIFVKLGDGVFGLMEWYKRGN